MVIPSSVHLVHHALFFIPYLICYCTSLHYQQSPPHHSLLSIMLPKTRFVPLLLAPVMMNELTSCHSAHSESSNWWFSSLFWKEKDEDSSHFDKFRRSTDSHAHGSSTMMTWPTLRKGLTQRESDEILIHNLIQNVHQNSKSTSKDMDEKEKIAISNTVSEILYGKGLTLQDRQTHLEMHGCAQSTPEALALIDQVVRTTSPPGGEQRGIVEIGVGYGQWARKLVDNYKIDIVAFDNMINLPLDPRIHNTKSEGYARYFFQGKVRFGDHSIFQNKKLNDDHHLNGRVLMLIFPDPGPMAFDCLNAYARGSALNDVLVYVGEGRGGANASDAFFDELERGGGASEWELLETCSLKPFGEKGFERLFVFKRRICKSN